jgi:hypothetical protein
LKAGVLNWDLEWGLGLTELRDGFWTGEWRLGTKLEIGDWRFGWRLEIRLEVEDSRVWGLGWRLETVD